MSHSAYAAQVRVALFRKPGIPDPFTNSLQEKFGVRAFLFPPRSRGRSAQQQENSRRPAKAVESSPARRAPRPHARCSRASPS